MAPKYLKQTSTTSPPKGEIWRWGTDRWGLAFGAIARGGGGGVVPIVAGLQVGRLAAVG